MSSSTHPGRSRSSICACALLLFSAVAVAQAPTYSPIDLLLGVPSFRCSDVADLNGNGVPDLLGLVPAQSGIPGAWDIGIAFDPGIAQLPSPSINVIAGVPLPTNPSSLYDGAWAGDFDGDGDQDILINAIIASGAFVLAPQILDQTAPGVFAGPQSIPGIPVGAGAASEIGDFDGDGRTDVAIQSNIYLSRPGSWILGFSAPGYDPRFGDFNGDSITDLVWRGSPAAIGAATNTIVIRPGGAAAANISLLAPINGHYVVGDVDGNGTDDIVTQNTGSANVLQLFRSASVGQWPTFAGTFPTSTGPNAPLGLTASFNRPLLISDIDGDGRGEVLKFIDATNFLPLANPNSIFIDVQHIVTGAPSTAWRMDTLSSYADIRSPQAADLDQDGDDEIITGSDNQLFPVVYDNRARYGSACAGAAGLPEIAVGDAYLGSSGLDISLSNAAPNSLAVLLLSFNALPAVGCGLLLDLSPSALILIGGQVVAGLTLANGSGNFSIAVPNNIALQGVSFAAQWAVVDPLGAFQIGAIPLAMTAARTVTIF